MPAINSTKKIGEFQDKSLLIVDDDTPLRDRLSRAMAKKGFQVIQAQGVKEGIGHIKNSPPAFAVIDLRLNDGNGLEVVKEIQKLIKETEDIGAGLNYVLYQLLEEKSYLQTWVKNCCSKNN